MITFLRKIRKSLVESGSARKYLLYALGEIALVVIGILIAIQLNDVNTRQEKRHKELVLLSEMKQNLKFDLDDLEWNINDNAKRMNSSQMVLNHLESQLVGTDSLSRFYGSLKGSTVLVKNTSAFDNLKSIGFDLITNDSLRQNITRLYSEKYGYMNHLEVEYDQRFQMEHLYHQVNSKIINPESEQDAKPLDYQSLVNDNLFKEMLRQNIGGKQAIINTQKDLKNFMIELVKSIEKEIAKG